MTRGKGPFSLANPWPRAAWGTLALILGISLVLGFIVLSRYQQNGEPLGVWALARFCLCTASLNRRSCFRPLCLCPGNPVSPQRRLWFEKNSVRIRDYELEGRALGAGGTIPPGSPASIGLAC